MHLIMPTTLYVISVSLSISFSRMRSRRVPVLRLGSGGPGGDQKSLRLCSPSVRKHLQASVSVRECRRVSESVAHRRDSQIVAKRRTVVTFYASRLQSVNSHRDRGVVVAKRRTVVTFYLSRLQSVNSHRDRGVVVAKRRTVVTFYLSRLQSVNSHRDRGVVVAKRRTVVTFGLVSSLRVSKVSTVTGIGGVLVRC